ncbi:Abhydrolase domain-containing protein C22H12.03 [Hypsizygus marmoreus]|uniref:Abhydrolase domain-containing protein C22H12.03 n=1 Tax=Hypsizygus marmoreus TaxID=39966 RepID=A0A369JWK9_HYPMA|nr:Abhydrolase domain-containing protein C22H12.03 [Hypsizygus marmoreus]
MAEHLVRDTKLDDFALAFTFAWVNSDSRMLITVSTRCGLRKRFLASILKPNLRYYSISPNPVPLAYTAVIPCNGNKTDGAVVILHGLFGSKRNFESLCKAFGRDLNLPIYALDLRNHGSSPHVTPMNYESMAADVLHFIQLMKLKDVSLLGHSMGGKVAMTLALESPSPLELSNLIISDIAPTQASISPSFLRYLMAMSKIEDPAMNIKTREAAGKILAAEEKDLSVRQFLLTNLMLPDPIDTSRTTVKFQIPIPIIMKSISALGSFPLRPDGHQWLRRTLVVKGARSSYIDDSHIPLFKAFFPNAEFATLDTGHWVHSERPNEFKKLMVDFILQGKRVPE